MRIHRVCLTLAAVAALSAGAVSQPAATRAQTALRITNISVGVSEGIATYYLCVAAATPPIGGGVAVTGPHGQVRAAFGLATRTCGLSQSGVGTTYLMSAAFGPLPQGSYTFQAACVTTNDGAVSCANPGSAFTLFASSTDTIAALCQVNFDPTVPLAPRNCAPGSQGAVRGDLSGAAPPPLSAPQAAAPFHTYLAEGYTGGATREYVSLYNPSPQPVQAQVTAYPAGRPEHTLALTVAPFQRATLDITRLVPRASVAIGVDATRFLAVERSMYSGTGGNAAAGLTPAQHWLFTHMLIGTGYAEWLPLFNPGTQSVTATVQLAGARGTQRTISATIPARTRVTLNLSQSLGTDVTRMVTVDAATPLVAEYAATLDGGRSLLADQGQTTLSTVWYVAEARTDGGRMVYLPVANPGDRPVMATLTLVLNDGSWLQQTTRVPAHGSAAFALHHLVHSTGLSAIVQASAPVSVEESAYLLQRRGGALVPAVAQAATSWSLAEGYTGGAFVESLALFNPGGRPALVRVRYTTRSGLTRLKSLHLAARGRVQWQVNADVPPGNVAVLVTSDQPVVVGRLMEFQNGWGITASSGVQDTSGLAQPG